MFEWIKGLLSRIKKAPDGKVFLGEGFNVESHRLTPQDRQYRHFILIEDGEHKGKFQPSPIPSVQTPIQARNEEYEQELLSIYHSGGEIYAPHPYENYGPDREVVDRVFEVCTAFYTSYGFERLYLIGSRARGKAKEDSDHDFVVVLADSAPDEVVRDNGLYSHLGVALIRNAVDDIIAGCYSPDIVVCRLSNFLKRKDVPEGGFPFKAEHEGLRIK